MFFNNWFVVIYIYLLKEKSLHVLSMLQTHIFTPEVVTHGVHLTIVSKLSKFVELRWHNVVPSNIEVSKSYKKVCNDLRIDSACNFPVHVKRHFFV